MALALTRGYSIAPMIVPSILMPFSTSYGIRLDVSFHGYVPVVGLLLGAILLACTVHALRSILHVWSRGVTRWFRHSLSVADPFVCRCLTS